MRGQGSKSVELEDDNHNEDWIRAVRKKNRPEPQMKRIKNKKRDENSK